VSHTTTLKGLSIKDAAAIVAAVAEIKTAGVDCELLRDTVPRMYFHNQHGKCAFVLKLVGSRYDLGLDLQDDGTYATVFDEWQGDIARKIGADGNLCPMPNSPEGKAQHGIGKFMQSYAKHAAMNAAVAQGYMVEGAFTDEKGNIQLTLAGM